MKYETERKYMTNPIGNITTEKAIEVLKDGFVGRIWKQNGMRRVYLKRLNNNRNAGYVDLNDGSIHWYQGHVETLVTFVMKCEAD